jgi:hypothetical protein
MIVIQNPSSGYVVEAGSIILWYGTAANLPSNWSVYSDLSGVMAKGANSVGASPGGALTHVHANQSTTGTGGSHEHTNAALGAFATSSSGTANKGTGSWDSVAAHSHYVSITSSFGSAAGHTHGLGNTNSASSLPPYKRLYFIQCDDRSSIPVGGIIMFKESYSSRPDGFNLCNGGSYNSVTTPDLRDKFIYGAEDESDVGLTGGAETHSHGQPNTDADGEHAHGASGVTSGVSGTTVKLYQLGAGTRDSVAKSHSHSWSNTCTADPDHSHTIPNTGSTSILPPFVKYYFLMRTQ